MKTTTIWILAAACLLSACSQLGIDTPAEPATTPAPAVSTAPEPPIAVVAPAPIVPVVPVAPLPTTPVDLSPLEGLSVEQLTERHAQAIAQGRLFSPAGNNAVELELALRHELGAAGQERYQPLLNDIAPNLVLMAEGAIARGDLAERDRLVNLMTAIDPTLPSLPRLREAVQAAQVDTQVEALEAPPVSR